MGIYIPDRDLWVKLFVLLRGYLWLVSLTFHSQCKGGCKHSIVDRSNLMWWQQFALGLHALPQLPVRGVRKSWSNGEIRQNTKRKE
jgi:hypothetical protein